MQAELNMVKPDKQLELEGVWKKYGIEGVEYDEHKASLAAMCSDFAKEVIFVFNKESETQIITEAMRLQQLSAPIEVDDEGNILLNMGGPPLHTTKEDISALLDSPNKYELYCKAMQGNAGSQSPILGYIADMLLGEVPDSLNKTDRYNLVGDLMELSGILIKYRGANWVSSNWADMLKSDRRNEVRGWLQSYSKFKVRYLNKLL